MKTYAVRNPCPDCPIDDKKQACYPGRPGAKQLCAKHSKLANKYVLQNPCPDCPIDDKKQASYPGRPGGKRLCAEHSKLAKTHAVANPCPDCPENDKKGASYPGRPGEKQLCGGCARVAGTHVVLNPCTMCPPNTKQAQYMGLNDHPCQLCEQHAKDVGTYKPQKRAQCANCGDTAYRWFSAESDKFAGEHACLPCLTCLDKTHPVAMRGDRELKCIGAIVELIRTQLGRPDIANTIRKLGFNDCAEGPSRRRGDQVFPVVTTLIGQIEVDEDNHAGYQTSCETAKVAGHIADRNGIHRHPAMDGDADETKLMDKVCHPDAGTQVVNTHVWRVDTTDAFKFSDSHREWKPVEGVFVPLMLRVAESIVAFVDSVTPSPSDTPAAASAIRAAVLSHPLWKTEQFHARDTRPLRKAE